MHTRECLKKNTVTITVNFLKSILQFISSDTFTENTKACKISTYPETDLQITKEITVHYLVTVYDRSSRGSVAYKAVAEEIKRKL